MSKAPPMTCLRLPVDGWDLITVDDLPVRPRHADIIERASAEQRAVAMQRTA